MIIMKTWSHVTGGEVKQLSDGRFAIAPVQALYFDSKTGYNVIFNSQQSIIGLCCDSHIVLSAETGEITTIAISEDPSGYLILATIRFGETNRI